MGVPSRLFPCKPLSGLRFGPEITALNGSVWREQKWPVSFGILRGTLIEGYGERSNRSLTIFAAGAVADAEREEECCAACGRQHHAAQFADEHQTKDRENEKDGSKQAAFHVRRQEGSFNRAPTASIIGDYR